MPPWHGNAVPSSATISALGTKNSTIVSSHQPTEETPMDAVAVSWSTTRIAATMNRVTSRKPMTRGRPGRTLNAADVCSVLIWTSSG